MILKGNAKVTALVGGIYAFKENGDYNEMRASVVFLNGIIQKIYKNETNVERIKKDFGNDIRIIRLDDGCRVFPGLIDLHNHIDYNTMPIWVRPNEVPWDNRHEWRHKNCFDYDRNIKRFHKFIFDYLKTTRDLESVNLLLQFLAEIQAISGGTTALQEPSEIGVENQRTVAASHLLLRSTGVPADLGLSSNQRINSIIDFFKPNLDDNKRYVPPLNTTSWRLTEVVNKETGIPYFREYLALLNKPVSEIRKRTGGYLVHLAEGRAGNLLNKIGIDAYSKAEFTFLKSEIVKIPDYAAKVRASRLVLIHGCGIDLNDAENIKFINNCGIGLVWSPVSNLLLYDDTPNYIDSGIDRTNLCLGSDWAPSGSKHLWDEGTFAQSVAGVAYSYPKNFGALNAFLFDMMTYNPARMLGADKLGEIAEGKFADFYIISKDRKLPDQLSNVFKFSDYHSIGTIINGNLVFGVKELFIMFGIPGVSISSDGKYSENLMVCMPSGLHIDYHADLFRLDKIFYEYSKMIGKTFVRSRFMSANDAPYRMQIERLKKKFKLPL